MSTSFVPYQIDFSAVAAGKRVSSTKRKMRWRFGYANPQALKDGRSGTDCRGEEHDVTIVWSLTSGKRQIMMDGREIHYSTNRAGILEFSWQSKGNHVIKVLCHAAPPMSAQPGFRQYDMSIDGQSFFLMPKVFQLGVQGAVSEGMPGAYRTTYAPTNTSYASANLKADVPTTQEQEEADLRRAIEASISESRQHLGEGSKTGSYAAGDTQPDLLGFAAPAVPASDSRSVASYYSAPTTYGNSFTSPPAPSYPAPAPPPAAASGAIVPAVAPPGYYQAPPNSGPPAYAAPAPIPAYTSPPPPASFSSPPPVPPAPHSTPAGDVFGLHASHVVDPFAPKPVTQQDLTNAIMASYQAPPAGAAAVPLTPTAPGAPAAPAPAPVTLSMNSLSLTTQQEKPKSDFERALSNLVNVDHIDEPAVGEQRLTMMKKEEPKKKQLKGKSVPKPPAGAGLAGSNAPLSQIKRDFQQPQVTTTEGVMNAPPPGVFSPGAAQAGALVVHGQGPPPLQQAQGFGVGQMLPNGGFQNQQNLAPGYIQQQRRVQY